jgi:homoserine dehydrogenase
LRARAGPSTLGRQSNARGELRHIAATLNNQLKSPHVSTAFLASGRFVFPARLVSSEGLGDLHVCENELFAVVRVGLIGCGTVGTAFVEALRARRLAIAERYGVWLDLVDVAVAHPERARPALDGIRVHGDGGALAADRRLDLVIEASTAREAGTWMRAALDHGAAVVSANKAAIASDPVLLGELVASESRLWCEAAVGGAVPIVRGLRESLAGIAVQSIRGVLNGTTTYVLSRMEQHGSFEEAVRAAQLAGYAEADPSADLSGADAASKLAILATLAWGVPVTVDEMVTRGIDATTLGEMAGAAGDVRRTGVRVRLVASATRSEATGAVRAFVAPTVLPAGDALHAAVGAENVIEIETELAGRLSWRGAGAGGNATASALLADAVAAARALVVVGVGARRA